MRAQPDNRTSWPTETSAAALAEAAAVAALGGAMESGLTSVGTSAVIEHKRASPIGAEVTVEAELIEVDDRRRLVFRFTATQQRPGSAEDDKVVVGTGTMTRAIVDRKRFAERAEQL